MSDKPKTITEYLSKVSEDKRSAILGLRDAIHKIVPDAEDGFSYGLPALRVHGRPLMAFGITKNHCSLYPLSPDVIEKYKNELKEFDTSKGTIRFTPDKQLPKDLLKKLVMARIEELENRNSAILPSNPRST